jgi:hypothetical protein
MFDFKIYENVQQAKKFLKDNNLKENEYLYTEIRKLLKGHDGYVGWFTKIAYSSFVSISRGLIPANDILDGNYERPMSDNYILEELKN